MSATETLEPLKLIPYGFVATRTSLAAKGVTRHTLDNWIKSGRLVSLVPGVVMRPDTSKLTWQGVVCSLQSLMGEELVLGGLTSLELLGLEHYLALSGKKTIHLYGSDALPAWVNKILPETVFVYHNAQKIFDGDPLKEFSQTVAWGTDDWPMTISSPERALFEVLLDVPDHLSFEHVDQLMQGLVTLSPRRLNRLLERCTNIKVKRLFLWLAERHQHPWLKKLELEKFTMESGALGAGKRMLAKGGRLDSKYLITVPEELHGPH